MGEALSAEIGSLDFSKENGLITAVVQDAHSGRVLMVGMMNAESLQITHETKRVTFWSRSKNRIWTKGESSGNFLELISIRKDCDSDALLIEAKPQGPTCHNGTVSCFDGPSVQTENFALLSQLEKTIDERSKGEVGKSYTAKLFSEGAPRIAQKVGEEGVEVAIAAQYGDLRKICEESADLVYHLLVLCRFKGIRFHDVLTVLRERMK
jgi:phosphoribosyl-ATP pyrophosphohydrolase/phosphoribosyl-AMP cyclohydrolase